MWVFANLSVEDRLRESRFIALVVAMFAVAIHIDDDIAVELRAKL